MKKLICSACVLVLFGNSFAQAPSEIELLFLRNHLSAGFDVPFLITKQEEHKGLGDFHLRTLPGFAMKVEYTYNFNGYFGITTGSKLGLQVFGFNVHADAIDFDLPMDLSRKYFQIVPFFSIPLMFNPRILIAKKHLLQTDLGASVIFSVPGNSVNTLSYKNGADTKEVFDMETRFKEPPQFTFHAGLTYGLVLQNQNILKIGFAYNFGIRNVMEGNYSFHRDDNVVGYGKIYSSFNYFAIELSYVFTRASSLAQ